MTDLEGMARILLQAILAIIVMGGFANGTLTLILTNFLKRLPFLNTLHVNFLAFAVSLVLTLAGLLSGWLGHEADFRNLLGFLETVLPPILTLLGGAYGSAWMYTHLKMQGVWFLGQPRDLPLFGEQRLTAYIAVTRGWD